MLDEKDIMLIQKMILESIHSMNEVNTEKQSVFPSEQEISTHDKLPQNESYSRFTAYEKHLSKRDGEERKAKVIFAMSGGKASKGSQTTRITLPITWVRDMGVTPDTREVTIKFKDNKIIIEKSE